jgi:hypothetical protein
MSAGLAMSAPSMSAGTIATGAKSISMAVVSGAPLTPILAPVASAGAILYGGYKAVEWLFSSDSPEEIIRKCEEKTKKCYERMDKLKPDFKKFRIYEIDEIRGAKQIIKIKTNCAIPRWYDSNMKFMESLKRHYMISNPALITRLEEISDRVKQMETYYVEPASNIKIPVDSVYDAFRDLYKIYKKGFGEAYQKCKQNMESAICVVNSSPSDPDDPDDLNDPNNKFKKILYKLFKMMVEDNIEDSIFDEMEKMWKDDKKILVNIRLIGILRELHTFIDFPTIGGVPNFYTAFRFCIYLSVLYKFDDNIDSFIDAVYLHVFEHLHRNDLL